MDKNNDWINSLSSHKDWLYEKMSSPVEGWTIAMEGKSVDIPLNQLDAVAYRILQIAVMKGKKVALALPRVRVGVSLSIIAYLTVNRFLRQQNRQLPYFNPIRLNDGQTVVIATRNRSLRDFFLESFLKFSNHNFPFTQFPISRLNRIGNIIPLVNKTTLATQLHSDPVVFYHFDEIENIPSELKGSYIIGELTETDSRVLAERLCEFFVKLNANSGLVLFNEYSKNTLDTLTKNGFEIIAFTNDLITNFEYKSEPNLPSLASSLANSPAKIGLEINLVQDDIANLKIGRIARVLSKINKRIRGDKPFFLFRAWSVFYNLKDLAVSLEKLESDRKDDIRLRSLSFSINQIFKTPISKLNPELQEIFHPIWSSLGAEFEDLYSHLLNSNLKGKSLHDLVQKALETKEKICIVFSSDIEAQIFKEELILQYGWVENDSNITVGAIDQLIISSQTHEHLIVTGIWRKPIQAKLLSLLPQKITLVCYSTELISVERTINDLNNNYIEYLKVMTTQSLNDIGITGLTNINTSGFTLIEPDGESGILIEHFKDLLPQDEDLKREPSESFDWLDGSQENIENLEADTVSEIQVNEEEIPVYQATLSNGRQLFIPVEQELYTYSEDSDIVELKLPEALTAGDVILIYSEEHNQEIFKSILQRTEELSKADIRIVNMWKAALKELREWYDVKNPHSLRAYLNDLHDLGCLKSSVTVKQWLKGSTMAPRDPTDIEFLLTMIKYKNAPIMSHLIASEIDKVRVFNRLLGKRLRARLENALKTTDIDVSHDKIDKEIDELLEAADIVTIDDISQETKYVAKDKVKTNIFG